MTLLAPRARRTRRLGEAQARVGLACGGAGGARLLTHLHMPASRATVLRLVTRMPMPDAPAPIRVGIDDWAIRKDSRYGTIVTASSTSSPIARHPRLPAGSNGIPASNSSDGIARRSMPEVQASAVPRRSRSPIDGTCSPTCGRPSNAGSKGPMPGCGTFHSSLARPFVPPGATVPSPAARRNWKRAHRAGCDGRLSTTRSAAGMPAGSPCSGSPVPWGWLVRRCASMRAPRRSRRGCLTVLDRACLIRTSRTWRSGSTRAARTRWPCGARSGRGATRGRAGRCTASSPSTGRGRSDQAANPLCEGQCIAAAWRSSIAAHTANGVVVRPATLGAGCERRSCGQTKRARTTDPGQSQWLPEARTGSRFPPSCGLFRVAFQTLESRDY